MSLLAISAIIGLIPLIFFAIDGEAYFGLTLFCLSLTASMIPWGVPVVPIVIMLIFAFVPMLIEILNTPKFEENKKNA